MQSKYKIHLLRANLFAAAIVLALWAIVAPPAAAVVLWLAVSWLLINALLLDFSHRRAKGWPWQIAAGGLLCGLIAVSPERHSILIWVFAAIYMLPQKPIALAFNSSAALLSWGMIAPFLSAPAWWLVLFTLSLLSLLAISRTRQLTDANESIQKRLRLIPGYNLWAGEQLLRDLLREQTRSEREAIHSDVVVIHVKRHQLWSCAQKLCELTYLFENVYRLNNTTLAVLLLSRSPIESSQRQTFIFRALPHNVLCHSIPLMDLEMATLTLEKLPALAAQPTGGNP